MKKEEIIRALYDANTKASIQSANDEWLACYQASSESDQQYLLAEYYRVGEQIKKRGEELNLEMEKVMAEYEAMKLEENQHP
ncbi:hypothetical protein SAMN05216327_103225 [Dyadobacter sp. SG02]|uniref:hypothetical protein n=1 Tax=Dyadobacter sp. SG02 TaxID=1855291 RepID=UPI0008AC482F|nr:hypothetical protein [Dyadobacter sp. SG02]SEI68237.1 hypothetical protein SAMN05216327_103225 [Dyadobacter sp. SG02]